METLHNSPGQLTPVCFKQFVSILCMCCPAYSLKRNIELTISELGCITTSSQLKTIRILYPECFSLTFTSLIVNSYMYIVKLDAVMSSKFLVNKRILMMKS